MKQYEAVFIFRPQIEETMIEKEISATEKIIEDNGASDIRSQLMGKRTLAYAIKKQNEGYYVDYLFQAEPPVIAKIKGDLKHRENVLRSIFFVREED